MPVRRTRKDDGSLWTWGSNSYGQLGDGGRTSQTSPVQVGTGYRAVVAGEHHTLALKTDAWGQGKKIKELGPVKPGLTIRYTFASPLSITGQGKEEQAAICQHIESHLGKWQQLDGINE